MGNIIPIILFVIIIIIYFASKILSSIPPKSEKATSKVDITKYDSKLLVNLSECEVSSTTGSVVNEKDSAVTRGSALLLLEPTPQSTYTSSDIYCSYVKFKTKDKEYNGGPIDKDGITVQALLLQKKTTYIYFMKNNPSDYFFDLNFIYE